MYVIESIPDGLYKTTTVNREQRKSFDAHIGEPFVHVMNIAPFAAKIYYNHLIQWALWRADGRAALARLAEDFRVLGFNRIMLVGDKHLGAQLKDIPRRDLSLILCDSPPAVSIEVLQLISDMRHHNIDVNGRDHAQIVAEIFAYDNVQHWLLQQIDNRYTGNCLRVCRPENNGDLLMVGVQIKNSFETEDVYIEVKGGQLNPRSNRQQAQRCIYGNSVSKHYDKHVLVYNSDVMRRMDVYVTECYDALVPYGLLRGMVAAE